MTFAKAGKQTAFSLVELLVVVTVISVLAALLLPSLMQALESSRKIVCLEQTRQLHLAFSYYADESEQFLPARNQNYNRACWVAGSANMTDAAVLFRNGYLPDRRVALCPSRANPARWGSNLFWTTWNRPITWTTWNQNTCWWGFTCYALVGASEYAWDSSAAAHFYWVRMDLNAPQQALLGDSTVLEPQTSLQWATQSNHYAGWGFPDGGNFVSFGGSAKYHKFEAPPAYSSSWRKAVAGQLWWLHFLDSQFVPQGSYSLDRTSMQYSDNAANNQNRDYYYSGYFTGARRGKSIP